VHNDGSMSSCCFCWRLFVVFSIVLSWSVSGRTYRRTHKHVRRLSLCCCPSLPRQFLCRSASSALSTAHHTDPQPPCTHHQFPRSIFSCVLTMTSTVPKLRYLSAWFCPYAHRATIALEHHAGRVEYEWVEVSSYRDDIVLECTMIIDGDDEYIPF